MFNFAFGGGHGDEDEDDHHHHGRGGPSSAPVDTEKFYTALGVAKDATQDQIKKAFRKAAMVHHPDKGGDPEKFKELNKAYEVLSDPDKRSLYDKYGEEGVDRGGPSMGPADIFDLFSGGRRGNPNSKRRGEDVAFPLKVTLEELYTGCVKKLRLTKSILCPDCEGKGGKADSVQTCKICKGQGVRMILRQIGPGMVQQLQTACNECNGQGTIIPEKDRCKNCEGQRTIKEKKTLDVNIQRGMKHAQRIVFHGEGDEAPNTIPGDVVVVLQRKEHEVFSREGPHLFMKKKLSLKEALCGFEFSIKHLDDRILVVKSEPNTVCKPGDWKVIKDEGMPYYKHPQKGNLYIEFIIEFPKSGTLAKEVLKTLGKILPDPEQKEAIPEGDHEDVHLENIDNIEEERKKFEQHDRDAHEEEEEHQQGGGAQGGCRPQ